MPMTSWLNWITRILHTDGRKFSPSRAGRRVKNARLINCWLPHAERLEDRTLLSAGTGCTSTTITVTASDSPVIGCFHEANGRLVLTLHEGVDVAVTASDGQVEIWANGMLESIPGLILAGDVQSIVVNGSPDDDLVDLSGVTPAAFTNLTGSTIRGGAGDDTLIGSAFADVIRAGRGNDSVLGGDGDDLLSGATGKDTLLGGNGDDRLFGGRGRDSLNGQAGDDVLKGQGGNDLLIGARGNDSLFGGAGNDRIFGGGGRDLLDGGTGNDVLKGQRGNDTVGGGEGSDTLIGSDHEADMLIDVDPEDELDGLFLFVADWVDLV